MLINLPVDYNCCRFILDDSSGRDLLHAENQSNTYYYYYNYLTNQIQPIQEKIDIINQINFDRKISVIKKIENKKILDLNLTEKMINNSDLLKNSIENSGIEDFICKWENCFARFEDHNDLISHVKQIHTIESCNNLYYCMWNGCPRLDRGFNARYKILVHIRTHTKEKPHQCVKCLKSFSRAENLKIHLRTHSGEKPYICHFDGCNKAYSNSSDRFKHSRTHIIEKPYICKIPGCIKRYTDPSSLRKHVKTFNHNILNLNMENLCNNNENSQKYIYKFSENVLPLDLSLNRIINNSKTI